jgi:hypothetical protein
MRKEKERRGRRGRRDRRNERKEKEEKAEREKAERKERKERKENKAEGKKREGIQRLMVPSTGKLHRVLYHLIAAKKQSYPKNQEFLCLPLFQELNLY